jgi:N-acetylglucosamine-6-phosphate deacetylase
MGTEIIQGTLILPDRVLPRGQVVVEDHTIVSVVSADEGYRPTHDFTEAFIAPGFVDIHAHGIAGADTMDARQDSIRHMAQRYAAHGVTAFLTTTMTESLDAIARAVAEVRAYMAEQSLEPGPRARILGVHLEGPWISPQFKGAQNERFIRDPDKQSIQEILAAAGGTVRKVTLAPERPGGEEAIRLFRRQDVYVSIGHTAATYEQALRAIDLGASHFTHCFNAMTALNHRRPGVVGAAMLCRGAFVELIADAIHVHPDVMRLLIQVKGREGVVLITDAMSATERADGTYALGGQEVLVRDGEARLADGTLAGSTLVMDQAVRNLVNLCRVPLVDAVYMAAASPADAIGLGGSRGKLRAGFDADLTILDRSLHPRAVMISGALHRLETASAPRL